MGGNQGEYFVKSTCSLPLTSSSCPTVRRDSLDEGPSILLVFSLFPISFPPHLPLPVSSGVYTVHTTLCTHIKSIWRGPTEVFDKQKEQNAIGLTDPFSGSYFATTISCWLLHRLSHHVSLATSRVSSSPPCSFAFKYTFKMFCFHALSQ